MVELLDPKNDYVFKRLFASAPQLLAELISAVRVGEPAVQVLEVLNPKILPEELTGKSIELDVLARDTAGQLFNVEVQVQRFPRWSARSTFYLSRLLATQLGNGQDYTELKPAVGVHLLNFDLFEGHPSPLWHFELRDRHDPSVCLGDELQLHVVELRKADALLRRRTATEAGATTARKRRGSKMGTVAETAGSETEPGAMKASMASMALPASMAATAKGGAEVNAALAAWVAFLEHWRESGTMSAVQYAPVQEAMKRLEQISLTEEDRFRALARERALIDEATWRWEATEGKEQAKREARSAGLAEGLAEGRSRAKAETLTRQLTHRFGPLPAWAEPVIGSATEQQLDAWLDGIFEAQSVRGLIGG